MKDRDLGKLWLIEPARDEPWVDVFGLDTYKVNETLVEAYLNYTVWRN